MDIKVNNELAVVCDLSNMLIPNLKLTINPDNGFTIGCDDKEATLSGELIEAIYGDRDPKRVASIIDIFATDFPTPIPFGEVHPTTMNLMGFQRDLSSTLDILNQANLKLITSLIPSNLTELVDKARGGFKAVVNFPNSNIEPWSTNLYAITEILYIANFYHVNSHSGDPVEVYFEVSSQEGELLGKGRCLVGQEGE